MIDPTCKYCGGSFTTEQLRDIHEGECRYNPERCTHRWHVQVTCKLCGKVVRL